MNRRTLLAMWSGIVGLAASPYTVKLKIKAVDAESFAQFALRERVHVELGVPGIPTTGQVSAIEERFPHIAELTEIRYRVDLDGPGYRSFWVPAERMEHLR